MNYTCPVCRYPKMEHPPKDYYICMCCGTEFGVDDFETSYTELRLRWIEQGAKWFDTGYEPDDWEAWRKKILTCFEQLETEY